LPRNSCIVDNTQLVPTERFKFVQLHWNNCRNTMGLSAQVNMARWTLLLFASITLDPLVKSDENFTGKRTLECCRVSFDYLFLNNNFYAFR